VDKLEERNTRLTEVSEKLNLQAVALRTAISVGRKSEEQLRDALAQVRELLDHSPAIIYSLRLDGDAIIPLQVSENITRMFGFPVADVLLPAWWAEHVHPDDLARADARIPQSLQRGEVCTEFRIRHRDGTYRWVEDNLRRTRGVVNGFAELTGVWTDVTDRRRAQDELHENERRSREMLDNLDLVSVMIDRNGLLTYCNDYFLQLVGWEREELLGLDWFSFFVPPELMTETRTAFSVLLTGDRGGWHHRNEIVTRAGERRLVQWNNSVLRSSSGDVIGVASIGEDVTNRALAERELRRSEEHLRIIVRASNDAVWEFNIETGEGRWSDRAYAILGYTPEQILPSYQNYIGLVHPDDLGHFRQAFKAHLERDEPYRIRFRLRHSNGSYISVLTRGQIERETGQMIGVFTDISIVEQAEEQIREQASLIDKVRDAVIVRDLDDRVIFWSKGAEHLYGWSSGEALGRPFDKLLCIDAGELAESRKAAFIDGARNGEGVRTTAAGELVIVDSRWTLLLDDQELPKGILTLDTDISVRKRAESRLQESEQRYRMLFDRNPHPSWVYDRETLMFLAVNDAAVAHYGHSRKEFLRMTIKDIRPPAELTHLLRVLEEGESVTPALYGVFTHLKKDGTRIDVEIASSEIAFDGRPAGLVLANDVTERRRIEQQYLRDQRLESLGTLAGGIAHDLNNLLMPILMGVTLLKRLGPDARALKTIDNIESSVKRGTDLVKRVLLFASGTEGEQKAVDLRTIVAEVQAFAVSSFPKNIAFSTRVQECLDDVIGDQTQLTQVLLNLCVNARDAMPGGGQLTIAAANTTIDQRYAGQHGGTAGHFVELTVTDDGSGIPKPVLERMFEPFFTTKEVGKGTGLGLSTVQGVLRSHGGFIDVTSDVGKGSTFRIYLPAHAHVEVAGKPAEPLLSRGDGQVILVVDDELSILTVTTQTLESYGYAVAVASDGAQALWLYARDHAHIAAVITDLMMPVMDGASLISALRRINPEVRIIAMSGQTDADQIAGIAENGVATFLSKPYSAGILLATLGEVLSAPLVESNLVNLTID
jgi:PAS domain S-box-containing protein